MTSPAQTLGKKERMKSRKRIDGLFNQGKKLQQFPFRLLYHILPVEKAAAKVHPYPVQAGFTASSRQFPRAVDRNRLKRLMREHYRTQKAPLVEATLKTGTRLELFLIYTGKELTDGEAMQRSLVSLIRKLAQEINEKNSSPA